MSSSSGSGTPLLFDNRKHGGRKGNSDWRRSWPGGGPSRGKQASPRSRTRRTTLRGGGRTSAGDGDDTLLEGASPVEGLFQLWIPLYPTPGHGARPDVPIGYLGAFLQADRRKASLIRSPSDMDSARSETLSSTSEARSLASSFEKPRALRAERSIFSRSAARAGVFTWLCPDVRTRPDVRTE